MGRKFTQIKDQPQRQDIRIPRLGRIGLGIKKVAQSGKEYPAEVDYFVCPPEVQAVFGEKPKKLEVMFPSENITDFFQQFYACYGGNQKLKCQGDGDTAERKMEDGSVQSIQCTGKTCEYGIKNKCSARFVVQAIIPKVNVGGTYQISSGSIVSDIDLRSGIEMTRSLCGRIAFVPVVIERAPLKMEHKGKMNTHYPIKCYPVANIDQVNMIRSGSDQLFLSNQGKTFLLEEPQVEGYIDDICTVPISPDEEAAIIAEQEASDIKVAKPEPKEAQTGTLTADEVKSILAIAMNIGRKSKEAIAAYFFEHHGLTLAGDKTDGPIIMTISKEHLPAITAWAEGKTIQSGTLL